jgi:hypothetical protein
MHYPSKGEAKFASSRSRQRRSHRARHAIPLSILVARALLLAQRQFEEQLLYAAIILVAGSILPNSTAVALSATDIYMALRFRMNVPNMGAALHIAPGACSCSHSRNVLKALQQRTFLAGVIHFLKREKVRRQLQHLGLSQSIPARLARRR